MFIVKFCFLNLYSLTVHPVVIANMTRINRSPGQTVLSCAFSGYPETITWNRSNGNMTFDTNRYIITRLINESIGVVESRLTIMLPVPSHYDTYSCLAENDFGSVNVVLVFSGKRHRNRFNGGRLISMQSAKNKLEHLVFFYPPPRKTISLHTWPNLLFSPADGANTGLIYL